MDGKKDTQNNSSNGWTDGELNDQHENNSPKGWTCRWKLKWSGRKHWPNGRTDGELNSRQANSLPNGWIDGKMES